MGGVEARRMRGTAAGAASDSGWTGAFGGASGVGPRATAGGRPRTGGERRGAAGRVERAEQYTVPEKATQYVHQHGSKIFRIVMAWF